MGEVAYRLAHVDASKVGFHAVRAGCRLRLEMGSVGLRTLNLDEALGADGLVAAARVDERWRVVAVSE